MIGQVKQIMVGLYLPFRIIQNTSKENYENEMINFLLESLFNVLSIL
jgi:hypothetical protein